MLVRQNSQVDGAPQNQSHLNQVQFLELKEQHSRFKTLSELSGELRNSLQQEIGLKTVSRQDALNQNDLKPTQWSLVNRKFFQRQPQNVKENQILSQDEMQQKLAITNLFHKFDQDGSGALDPWELTSLYNQNGVAVTEKEIQQLYGAKKIKFTLEMFESMSKQTQKLRNYRLELAKMKNRLERKAGEHGTRSYIPSTFDQMMLDFGCRVQRKEIDDEYLQIGQQILQKPRLETPKIQSMCDQHAQSYSKFFQNTTDLFSLMNSTENELFRKIKLKALKIKKNEVNQINDSTEKEVTRQYLKPMNQISRNRTQFKQVEALISPSREARRQVKSFMEDCRSKARTEARVTLVEALKDSKFKVGFSKLVNAQRYDLKLTEQKSIHKQVSLSTQKPLLASFQSGRLKDLSSTQLSQSNLYESQSINAKSRTGFLFQTQHDSSIRTIRDYELGKTNIFKNANKLGDHEQIRLPDIDQISRSQNLSKFATTIAPQRSGYKKIISLQAIEY